VSDITFIGLGNMGGPMAINLVKAGYDVRGFDLAKSSKEAASQSGIVIADSAAEAARGASVVITMLPAGSHVLSTWRDIIPVVAPNALLIDCSTVDVASAREAHELSKKAGLRSVDAPVSGGTMGAQHATLTFMVGGETEAFDAARAILQQMGPRIIHCGAPGAGQAAKICNNMILGISMIGVSEAFALAERLGLSHQALFDVASISSGQCWSLTTYCPVPGPVPTSPANKDYQAGFSAALMLKDLRLSQEAAGDAGAVTPLGAHAQSIYEAFVNEGHGTLDFSGVIAHLRGLQSKH
jgi:3-hydroxyisobutyrate dehydrogenase